MAVESVTYINNLDPSLPSGGDSIAEGDDHIRNVKKGIKSTFPNVTGAVNLTAPNPVTQAEFTKTLAKVLRRPSFLPVPSFGPKLLLGSELADALLFTGQKVMPEILMT